MGSWLQLYRLEICVSRLFSFFAKDIKGRDVPLSSYRGNVMLIVNTASKCGFTSQYRGLQELYADYAPRGFTVLGFPCNQFLHQEPGTADQKIGRESCRERVCQYVEISGGAV